MYNCRRRARLYICNIVLQLVILFVLVVINCFFSLYHLSLSLHNYIYIYIHIYRVYWYIAPFRRLLIDVNSATVMPAYIKTKTLYTMLFLFNPM